VERLSRGGDTQISNQVQVTTCRIVSSGKWRGVILSFQRLLWEEFPRLTHPAYTEIQNDDQEYQGRAERTLTKKSEGV